MLSSDIKPYERRIYYYETDKMITHHSNYIRLMEEARVDYLRQIGWGFTRLEGLGFVSPVVSVSGEYKHPTAFDELISAKVKLVKLRAASFELEYRIASKDSGLLVFVGSSQHCFTKDGKPVNLKKAIPEFYRTLSELLEIPE